MKRILLLLLLLCFLLCACGDAESPVGETSAHSTVDSQEQNRMPGLVIPTDGTTQTTDVIETTETEVALLPQDPTEAYGDGNTVPEKPQ